MKVSNEIWVHPYKDELEIIDEHVKTKSGKHRTHCSACIRYVRAKETKGESRKTREAAGRAAKR